MVKDPFERNIWQKIRSFWNIWTELFERIFFWGWNMRWSYDFDGYTVYRILYLKLNRMYKCFRDYGHLVWNSDVNNKEMRKLRIARELAKRLYENDYSTHLKKVEEKYGELQMGFSQLGCYFYMDKTTKDNQGKAYKERQRAIRLDALQRESEKEYLFRLLNKNLDSWWD